MTNNDWECRRRSKDVVGIQVIGDAVARIANRSDGTLAKDQRRAKSRYFFTFGRQWSYPDCIRPSISSVHAHGFVRGNNKSEELCL